MKPTPEDIQHSRRAFLRTATTSVGLVLSASAISSIIAGCETDETPAGPTGRSFEVDVSTYPELAAVGGITIDIIDELNGSNPIFLSRVSDTAYAAFSAVCTHQGCTVQTPFDDTLPCECPCHGAQYSRTDGKIVRQPSTGSATDLKLYQTSFNASTNILTITDFR